MTEIFEKRVRVKSHQVMIRRLRVIDRVKVFYLRFPKKMESGKQLKKRTTFIHFFYLRLRVFRLRVRVKSPQTNDLYIPYQPQPALKREIDHRLATHFHPAALSAQIAEVGQTEGRSQAKLLLK